MEAMTAIKSNTSQEFKIQINVSDEGNRFTVKSFQTEKIQNTASSNEI